MKIYLSAVDTPLGPFTLVVDHDGSVLASGWTGDSSELLARISPRPRDDPRWLRDLGPATRAVRAYHDGDLSAPAAVAVHLPVSSGFVATAQQALREVAPGRPITYTELAARAGRRTAARAAAQACARNPAALFVPCHRVVRTDGSLGGFRWGLQVKRALLAHEAAAGSTRTATTEQQIVD